jgi:hypothetical protein
LAKSAVFAVPPKSLVIVVPSAKTSSIRSFDIFRRVALADVFEHQNRRHQNRRRIRHALTGDVGRGTVNGFKNRADFADVSRPARVRNRRSNRRINRNNIAVKIFHYHYVELLRIHHQLHTAVVNDFVVRRNFRVIFRHIIETFEKSRRTIS